MILDKVVVRAPAKVNLSLSVGALGADGFHQLATVYEAIGVYDQVSVRRASYDEFTVTVESERCSVSEVPTDDSNLAIRAARLLAARRGIDGGAQLSITKAIPVAGGMAGGSADAAAALVACDTLWGSTTPRVELMGIAAELGSDVPFCLVGGTAIGTGRGEVLAPVMTLGTHWWVVVESPPGLSTPQVYLEFDRERARRDFGAGSVPSVPEDLMAALGSGDVRQLGGSLSNDLQAAALRLRPELGRVLGRGIAGSALGAVVSGSGPSCLFLAESKTHAIELSEWFEGHGLGPVAVAPGPVAGARVVG